jgi:ribosomal protein S18 acetylase RimI-like enzyme
MNIKYSTEKIDLADLEVSGFFDGWEKKPSEDILRESIENADHIVLAIDTEKNKLVGYITALSDGVLAAYIPFLEVEKSYQHKGIGHTLVNELLKQIGHLYMIDLICDKEKAGFYEVAGFKSWHAMIKRNYSNQSGAPSTKIS